MSHRSASSSISMMTRNTLPSPVNTSPSDSESEILLELDQKRRQINDEIGRFKVQKEKEFQDFERDLRTRHRRNKDVIPPRQRSPKQSYDKTRPHRPKTPSSSALELLTDHGACPKCSHNKTLCRKDSDRNKTQASISKTSPSASKPTLSLEPLNITGETVLPHHNAQSQLHTPPTPTLLTQTLSRSSSIASIASTPPRPKPLFLSSTSPSPDRPATPTKSANTTPKSAENTESAEPFLPTYLPLVEARSNAVYYPPPTGSRDVKVESGSRTSKSKHGHDAGTKSERETFSLQSSSYPPSTQLLSSPTHGHTSKRSYTAPTGRTYRIPSALRRASSTTLGRKRKHVTFRLADSAIVEPSSSYEEGSSPQLEEADSEESLTSRNSDRESSDSSQQSSKKSRGRPRSGTGSAPKRSRLSTEDVGAEIEDVDAGVMPGMGMGEVMEKLNHYHLEEEESDQDRSDLLLSPNEPSAEGQLVTNHLDAFVNEPNMLHRTEQPVEQPQATVDSLDEDGYFSPKSRSISSIPAVIYNAKDMNGRLYSLIDGTPREESNQTGSNSTGRSASGNVKDDGREHKHIPDQNVAGGGGGGGGGGRRTQTERTFSNESASELQQGLRQSLDGGSGVGFFELDEELASPDAGVARPLELKESDDTTVDVVGEHSRILDKSKGIKPRHELAEEKRVAKDKRIKDAREGYNYYGDDMDSSDADLDMEMGGLRQKKHDNGLMGFGVGSVPINIIRHQKPSSVSDSWVGTFGH